MVALRDELDIPMPAMTPGYRMARPAPRVDPNTRRLAIIAGGIGAALLVIMGGWTLIGGGRGGVPVVQAPSGPVRVKPADAGGMQVAGANESILSDRTAAGEAALAPPPETPALAALKAQEAANAKAAAAATLAAAPPPAAETPAQASGQTGTQTGVQTDSRTAAASPPAAAAPVPLSRMIGPKTAEHPAAPASSGGWVTERPAEPGHALARAEPAPAAQTRPAAAIPSAALPAAPNRVAARPEPARPAARVAPGHGVQVQFAALGSEQAARAEWTRLDHRMPSVLRGRAPAVMRVVANGHVFWRLRTGGFADTAQAQSFCREVKAHGGGCAVASF